MYLFGHVGLTVAAARDADPDLDWRLAALLAVGPDIVDKPLRLLVPALVHRNTRSFGHTLLATLLVWAALRAFKARRPGLLWACWAGHLVLDRMWTAANPIVLLWPLLGAFPPPALGEVSADMGRYDLAGEAAGLLLLVYVIGRASGGLAGRRRRESPPPQPRATG